MSHNFSEILSFLRDLANNNNRVWFADNKQRYLQVKGEFDEIVTVLIAQIAMFDKSLATLSPKDCTYRIYRDVRFHDKDIPYKIHFGAFMAPHGGRRSEYGGYYLHVQPGGQSFLSTGIWAPQPDILKSMRNAIYSNFDEFTEILTEKNFATLYGGQFFENEMLKKLPQGFPKDFEGAYYLKLKHYLVSCDLSDDFLTKNDCLQQIVENFKIACPFNQFLNYTVEEIHNPQSV